MTEVKITDDDIGDKLRGKIAIVTGGSSGIGEGIVHYLVKSGAKVLIGDLQTPKKPIEGTLFQKTNAGSWEDLLALFKRAESEYGRIDIVIPNAGFGDKGDYFDHKDTNGDPIKPDFDCLTVTLIGQMYTVKLAMHFMRKQRPQGGVIVSTVSRSGYDCQSIPVYAAAKHGMIGLMRGLRNHTPFWNIRINSIAPHVTDTAATRVLPSLIPDLQRIGIPVSTVEETARAAAFLAANEEYNGCTISIMGSEYRELESGVERHKTDIMGNDPRFDMNAEQREVMGESIILSRKWIMRCAEDTMQTTSFRRHQNGDVSDNYERTQHVLQNEAGPLSGSRQDHSHFWSDRHKQDHTRCSGRLPRRVLYEAAANTDVEHLADCLTTLLADEVDCIHITFRAAKLHCIHRDINMTSECLRVHKDVSMAMRVHFHSATTHYNP